MLPIRSPGSMVTSQVAAPNPVAFTASSRLNRRCSRGEKVGSGRGTTVYGGASGNDSSRVPSSSSVVDGAVRDHLTGGACARPWHYLRDVPEILMVERDRRSRIVQQLLELAVAIEKAESQKPWDCVHCHD
jgi:hypothetical protein